MERSEWRVFIAIPLPEHVKRWIKSQSQLCLRDEEQLYKRRTDWNDYHITIQFLGDVAEERIPSIVEQMKQAASIQRAFELRLGTWDTFGLPHSPRVLWLGVEGERQQLDNLHQQVTARMSSLGFISEKRPYYPHITIARQYQGSARFDIDELREHSSSTVMPSWQADQIILYRTHLGQRPMYEAVGEARMMG